MPRSKFVRPGYLFHGTLGENLASILKEGIKPASKPGMGASATNTALPGSFAQDFFYDQIGTVGLTTSRRAAGAYATATSLAKGKSADDELAVLEVARKKLSRHPRLRKGSNFGYSEAKEYDYPEIVLPSAIEAVWRYKQGVGWVRESK